MGNTGKPSRACAVCKKRKIKCDLTAPRCQNCRISGWDCPGPLSMEDVTFRKPKMSRSSSSQSPSALQLARAKTPLCPRELSIALDDRATAFFFRQYMLSVQVHPGSGGKRGVYEFLPLLVQQEGKSGLLQTVISACGLAALANAGKAAEWQTQAYGMLTKAIGQLKVNLQDAEARVSDQTLAAIMLMGTFETIVSGDMESMRSYSKHVMAAAHCIEWRGPTQFQNEASVKLFAQLRPIIIMTCHQLQEPIPYALKRWSLWAEHGQREEEISSNGLAELNEQLLTIRAQLKYCQSFDLSELIVKLLHIDSMVENWKDSLPTSWAYSSYPAFQDRDGPLPSFMAWNDEYPDLWIASIWNNYRVVRLVIHETLVTVLNKYGTPEHDHILQNSFFTLSAMGEEICHSVSYHLGPTTHGMRQITKPPGYRETTPTPGGSLILWPLFLSGLLRTTLYEQRMWITARLREIGLNMGLRLAISMADTLEHSGMRSFSDSETWLIGEFSF